MAHLQANKKKLLNRIRRIQGQLQGVENALEQDKDCTLILQSIAACRGAINGLMNEVVEGHIRHHLLDAKHTHAGKAEGVEELIDILKTYLK